MKFLRLQIGFIYFMLLVEFLNIWPHQINAFQLLFRISNTIKRFRLDYFNFSLLLILWRFCANNLILIIEMINFLSEWDSLLLFQLRISINGLWKFSFWYYFVDMLWLDHLRAFFKHEIMDLVLNQV